MCMAVIQQKGPKQKGLSDRGQTPNRDVRNDREMVAEMKGKRKGNEKQIEVYKL